VDFLASPVDGGFEGENLILGAVGDQQAGDGSWRGYRLGEGIEGFRFANGNYLTLDELLAGATVVSVLDNYAFRRNSGEQVIDRRYPAVEFADGIGSSEISFVRDGLDLLVVSAGAIGRIQGWYEDPANLPQLSFEFEGEPTIDAATATGRGLEIRGTSGSDSLVGLDAYSDRLFGGAGDDYLDGGGGADTYLFNAGDGADVVADSGPSVIQFGEGVIPGLVWTGLGSLVVNYGEGDAIHFTAFNADDPYATRVFDRLEFTDGSTILYEDLLANGFYLNGTEDDDVITGSGLHDQIFGNGGDDTLAGRGANDEIHGGEGDDTLSGGPGDGDVLGGGEGADTFVYAAGDGWDEVYEWDETPGEVDRVQLQGFDVANVRVTRNPWNYYLVMDGGDRLTLGDMLIDAAAVVERIEFEDGTVWTPADLEARVELLPGTEGEDILWGTSGNDSISGLGAVDDIYGNGGDDMLAGGEGEDFYYFAAGDGHDTVDNVDTDGSSDGIQFTDAASTDVALSRNGSDLVLTTGADSVAIAGWYADASHRIDAIHFDGDGAFWDATIIEQLAPAGGNSAPQVTIPLADVSFEAGAAFEFLVSPDTFIDPDAGDVLALSATLYDGSALPAWLTFDASSGAFAGLPQSSNIGVSHVAVTATDASGASATSAFGLVVRAVAGSTVIGGAADDAIYGGTGDETLIARGGSDYVYGDEGDDLLRGGQGNDVLQGGAGSDVLRGGAGQNVLDGGAGDDLIYGGQGSAFIAGGAGNDILRVGSGNDLIAFNAGDGVDTVYGGRDGGNTLSFGGGIRYSDLSLSKSGKDLVVSAGGDDRVVLKNWYGGNHSVLNLQIVLDATEEFDAGSGDPLYNRRVQTFDFQGMVSAFDAARVESPGVTSWAMTNALLQFHLSGANDAALGGDLAYWYGKSRSLQGVSVSAAQQVIGAPGFGSEAQSLRPFSGLQEGLVKLS
jgi:Ca2+-binding RTX toxin-like protein